MAIVFIEESCFLAPGFINLLENLVNDGSLIYVEQQIEQTITNLKAQNRFKEAYIIEGYLDILESLAVLKKITTNSYFDFSHFDRVIKQNQNLSVLILTQKESVYKNVLDLKNKYKHVAIARFSQNLIYWDDNSNDALDAFYLDNDQYINKVDIENLDYVYSPKYGHLCLDKRKTFKGGEGILYPTYNNQLCKLYFKDHQTYVNFKKLNAMLEIDIHNPFINWPKDILFYKNDFVGYLMDEVKAAESLDVLRINAFKGYNIFERYLISYNLLLNIDYLHKRNIIVGDLKLDNILIKSPEEVYLVDCGSCQIGDFACNVCHPEYTKRVYTADELKQKLRTVEDEYYPINKIIFEILIGKNPNYNRYSGEVDIENKNNFYFPLDLSEIKEYTGELYMWRGLSERMRTFFYYYFKENKITYLSEWINELELYIKNAQAMKIKGER